MVSEAGPGSNHTYVIMILNAVRKIHGHELNWYISFYGIQKGESKRFLLDFYGIMEFVAKSIMPSIPVRYANHIGAFCLTEKMDNQWI